ncbi:amino acid ABC transporter permease, partial [Enterococcus faecium]
YILVALIYWVICIGMEKVQQYLEKRYIHQSI